MSNSLHHGIWLLWYWCNSLQSKHFHFEIHCGDDYHSSWKELNDGLFSHLGLSLWYTVYSIWDETHRGCCTVMSPRDGHSGRNMPQPGSGSPDRTPWYHPGPSFPECPPLCPLGGCSQTRRPLVVLCTCHKGSTVSHSGDRSGCSYTCLSFLLLPAVRWRNIMILLFFLHTMTKIHRMLNVILKVEFLTHKHPLTCPNCWAVRCTGRELWPAGELAVILAQELARLGDGGH